MYPRIFIILLATNNTFCIYNDYNFFTFYTGLAVMLSLLLFYVDFVMCVCVCVRVCVRARVWACVCVRARTVIILVMS